MGKLECSESGHGMKKLVELSDGVSFNLLAESGQEFHFRCNNNEDRAKWRKEFKKAIPTLQIDQAQAPPKGLFAKICCF